VKQEHEDFLARYSNRLPDGSKRNLTALGRAFVVWADSRPLWIDIPGPDGATERVANAELIRGYEKHLKRRYAPGTIRKNWAVLHRMYVVNKIDWPFRHGDAPVVPEKDVHNPRMHPSQIEKMIDVALGLKPSLELNPQPQHVACLVLSTIWGLRRGEMQEVSADIIDTKIRDGYGTIYVETLKKGRQRYHLIPSYLIKPLTDFGFTRHHCVDYFSNVFTELKIMCGFTGDSAYGVGWHAIRRSAVLALEEADLRDFEIDQYFRWKIGGRGMRARYASTPVVIMGEEGEETIAAIGSEDRALDLKVYEVHPFLRMWKERLASCPDKQ